MSDQTKPNQSKLMRYGAYWGSLWSDGPEAKFPTVDQAVAWLEARHYILHQAHVRDEWEPNRPPVAFVNDGYWYFRDREIGTEPSRPAPLSLDVVPVSVEIGLMQKFDSGEVVEVSQPSYSRVPIKFSNAYKGLVKNVEQVEFPMAQETWVFDTFGFFVDGDLLFTVPYHTTFVDYRTTLVFPPAALELSFA